MEETRAWYTKLYNSINFWWFFLRQCKVNFNEQNPGLYDYMVKWSIMKYNDLLGYILVTAPPSARSTFLSWLSGFAESSYSTNAPNSTKKTTWQIITKIGNFILRTFTIIPFFLISIVQLPKSWPFKSGVWLPAANRNRFKRQHLFPPAVTLYNVYIL